MFDNLPFFPAIEVLGTGQTSWRQGQNSWPAVLERVKQRTKKRDIIIAAGLDAEPVKAEPGHEPVYDTLFKIQSRAKSLSVDSKARTFEAGAAKVRKTLEQIQEATGYAGTQTEADYLDSTVNAAILKIVPTDKDHINPTFAFCRAVGLDVETVQKSIADGCFRSLAAFLDHYVTDGTVRPAFEKTNVPGLAVTVNGEARPGECPYFHLTGKPLGCPFAAAGEEKVSGIRNVCAQDKAHQKQSKALSERADVPKVAPAVKSA
jgi:hypothetical protein